jgi:hypothetical protein
MSELTDGDDGRLNQLAQSVIGRVVGWGVDGLGPIKGAAQIAEEHLAAHGDPEAAIGHLIATHTRLVAATGFATGFGGFTVATVTIPADITALYALAARCSGAIAILRGYDIRSEEVRSVVLLTLIGSAGAGVAAEVGAQLGTKTAFVVLRRLPGKVLFEINKKVGFRLVTKFGTKGVINLGKLVPVAGGLVSSGVNVATMQGVGRFAKRNFPLLTDADTGKADGDGQDTAQ